MEYLKETFSKLELESANDLLKTIVPLEPLRDKENSFKGVNQSYDSSFKGSLMRRGLYHSCEFENVQFCGTVGNNSKFYSSQFKTCDFINANFIYSNFSNSFFTDVKFNSSTYNFSDFSGTVISNSNLEASSLRECYFYQSIIKNSKIFQSEFTGSTFYNCVFEDLDLSVSTLDFSEFIAPIFNNVTLPFFGVLNLISGFEQIVNQKGVSFKPASSQYTVKSEEYIENIRLLKPVFAYENNFLALANIYAYDREIENTYSSILGGLAYACKEKDFSLIRHLCKFASVNNYFTLQQLRAFYNLLEENIDVRDLEYVEYRNYLNELNVAKSLLIDCPFKRDIMNINLKTSFHYNDAPKLAESCSIIDYIIKRYAPDSNNHIIIRHNSPIDINIIISDNINSLYLIFFALQIVLCKSFNVIEKIQNIIKNHHEIKLQKLEETMRESEIEKLQEEIKKNISSSILVPEDFESISYILNPINNNNMPKTLRKM